MSVREKKKHHGIVVKAILLIRRVTRRQTRPQQGRDQQTLGPFMLLVGWHEIQTRTTYVTSVLSLSLFFFSLSLLSRLCLYNLVDKEKIRVTIK